MLNVQIERVNGILVTTSNRVAEELGILHKDLLEKIDNYLSRFNSAELSAQFYIPSIYRAKNGRKVRNYLITKKGIAQLIGGYSSAVEKAFELNVAYINKFDEMEKILNQQLVQGENTSLLKEIERLREIEKQYNNIPMSWAALECVKDQINETIDRRCKTLRKISKVFKRYLYVELEKEIFEKFGINNLQDLKEKDYQTVMPYIFYWIESYSLRNKYITE